MSWVASWSATLFPNSPIPAFGDEGLSDQTIRMVLPFSVGGSSVRVRLSNRFGQQDVTFESVTVGLAADAGGAARDSLRRVSFGGRRHVRLAPGAEALSDPADVTVQDLDRVAVSLHAREPTGPPTRSDVGPDVVVTEPPRNARIRPVPVSFVAPGDATDDESGAGYAPAPIQCFVAAVDVLSDEVEGTVVVLGDSTSVGYPGTLARRGVARPRRLAVVHAAIGGNRLLTSSPCFGSSGLVRFPHDVVAQSGVRAVVAMWINDIGMSGGPGPGDEAATRFPTSCFGTTHVGADDLIAGWRQLLARAHAHGIRVLAGTTPPFKGAGYYTSAKDAIRHSLNEWILGGEADGVVDFDALLRDPSDPDRLDARYHIGDCLHPGAAASRAMADAVDLDLC